MITPVEKKVGVGEYTLRYAEAGKGESLVMLHGSDHRENWRVWEPLLQLSEGNHLIMPDLLGYGGSSKPTETPDHRKQALVLHELMERLALEKVSIVGSSWGGQIALEYALEWPATVNSLVLIASTYDKDQLPRLRKMGRPTLIIWAEDDLVTQLKAGYSLRDAIATSRLETLPPVAKDPRFGFTISHKLERFRSEEILGLIMRFIRDPEGVIMEPPEMENELRGMALKKKDDEREGGITST
ncbi:MAG: alpha/beta hydrolase [Thaumarchaeota archaeon]|nr:MAG: alpha/beta hydrolase [Nitrososphaerota archaeon]